MTGAAKRVRVTSPRTSATRTRRVAPASEIDGRTRLGEVYLSSLLRAQLRLAVGVLAMVGGLVLGLPLLFFLVPELTRVSVLSMPLPWVLLGFAVYPVLFFCAWLYVHRAEHNDRVFAALVSPEVPGVPAPGTSYVPAAMTATTYDVPRDPRETSYGSAAMTTGTHDVRGRTAGEEPGDVT